MFAGQFLDKIKMRKDLFGDDKLVSLEGGFLCKFDDGVKIMQYTGLRDKNGKEIYEGDVVKIVQDGDETTHIVKWFGVRGYPAFDLEPQQDTCANELSDITAAGEIEVIGNIYEHPHLLEQTNDKN